VNERLFNTICKADPLLLTLVRLNITLVMTVTNTGEADSLSTIPVQSSGSTYLAKLGTANPVALFSGPSPASQTVPGLSTRAFTFVYTVNGAGTVAFSGGARGTDSILLSEVNGIENSSNYITVENIASLSAAMLSTPTAVNLGQIITAR
jgi:hypothetical protein